MATTSIYIPGLVNGANSTPVYLAVTDNMDGTVTLNTTTGGSAKLYFSGMVDGAAQSTPVALLATDNGGGIFTLNVA